MENQSGACYNKSAFRGTPHPRTKCVFEKGGIFMKSIRCAAALLCLTAILASCGETALPPEETTAEVSSAPDETEPSRENEKSSLPDDLDFGGETVTVLMRSEEDYAREFSAESENGDVVNDAVWRRNLAVQEKLNVKLETIARPGSWGKNTAFINQLRSEVMADAAEFDVIAYYAYCNSQLAAEGLLTELSDLPYVDADRPWWSSLIVENGKTYGKNYLLSGDIVLSNAFERVTLFYNKELAAEWKLDGLYDMVFDGTWTFEAFRTIVKDIWRDLNGDSAVDAGDFFGYEGTAYLYDAFVAGMDVKLTEPAKDGGWDWCVFTERNTEIVDRVNSLLTEKGVNFTDASNGTDITNFVEGKVIFSTELLSFTEKLRDMKADYGILPMPKYDENQKEYYTITRDNYSQVCVPVTCRDLKKAGAFLECAAEQSYKTVTPAYYEQAMKTKYLRDDESSRIFDLIIAGEWHDFGEIYTLPLGGTGASGGPICMIRAAIINGGFASLAASMQPTMDERLSKLLDDLENLA